MAAPLITRSYPVLGGLAACIVATAPSAAIRA